MERSTRGVGEPVKGLDESALPALNSSLVRRNVGLTPVIEAGESEWRDHRSADGGYTRNYTNPDPQSSTHPRSLCAGRAEPERERIRESEGCRNRRTVEKCCRPPASHGYDGAARKAAARLLVVSTRPKREGVVRFHGRRRFLQPSEQSGHRNALSPAQRVSPGQRVGAKHVCLHLFHGDEADQSRTKCERSCPRSVSALVASERVSPAMVCRTARSYIRPYAPVEKASHKAERQTVYQDKYPGLVEVLAVGPAGVGDAPGNGRGVR